MFIGLCMKWIILGFMTSINMANGMYDAFLWGGLLGFVVYVIVNGFTQAVVPGLGVSYAITNVIYGTFSTAFASVAACYII